VIGVYAVVPSKRAMENVSVPAVELVSVLHTSTGIVGSVKLGAVGVEVVVNASNVAPAAVSLMSYTSVALPVHAGAAPRHHCAIGPGRPRGKIVWSYG